MHPCLVLLVKLSLDTLPGMTQQFSWTFVNLGYLIVSSRAKTAADPNLGWTIAHFCGRRYPTSCSTGQPVSRSRQACTAARMTTSRFGSKSTRASSLPPQRNGSFASPSCCTYSAMSFPCPPPVVLTPLIIPRSAQVLVVHTLYTL